MNNGYMVRCNQFCQISNSFYEKYNNKKQRCDFVRDSISPEMDERTQMDKLGEMILLLDEMEESAIIAIVFQAMAIESYVNFAGEYLVGRGFCKKNFNNSVVEKLEVIEKTYKKSISAELKGRLKRLFQKRNALVHHKPIVYPLEKQGFDYQKHKKITDKMLKEASFIEESIEKDIGLYEALQKELMNIREAEQELLEEVRAQ